MLDLGRLAFDINNIIYDFNPYEYNDNNESRYDGLIELINNLATKPDYKASVIEELNFIKNEISEYTDIYNKRTFGFTFSEIEKIISDLEIF